MSGKLDAVEPVRELVDDWAASLAQVLESMTDAKPGVHWHAASGSFEEVSGGGHTEVLWWEQPFQFAPGMNVWVAAPRATWEYAGTLTLKAAGLETVEEAEAKNTWSEILGQSLSVMARSIGSLLGREVTCDTGSETAAGADAHEWASVSIAYPDAPPVPLFVCFSEKLLGKISAPPKIQDAEEHHREAERPEPEGAAPPVRSRTMELLLEVDLPVSISFGKTQLPMREVLKLTTGSIVELNRGVGEPVEVLVNHFLVARGEVVVVEGNYGVRILEIASRNDRLRSIR